MLSFHDFQLKNGLPVLVHPIQNSQIAVCNLMYCVGSANESPDRTGLAHFFEHLMFTGTKRVPHYDKALQKLGGQNNAYTTFDVTSYHCTLPAQKVEQAFELEADRMLHLACDPKQLEIQRKVVIEEFKQGCLNLPYGDLWHHLLALAYEHHPYSWPTIGKEISHIESFTRQEVYAFQEGFYHPQNAVLVVAGGVDPLQVYQLAEKVFTEKRDKKRSRQALPTTARIQKEREKNIFKEVPFELLVVAFHIPGRAAEEYLGLQMITHILSSGNSSLLYRKLVEEERLLTDISVYTTETFLQGLFVVKAILAEGTHFEKVEKRIEEILDEVCGEPLTDTLWEKAQNHVLSEYAFAYMSVWERADHLATATLLKEPDFFNQEVGEKLTSYKKERMQEVGRQLLQPSNSVRLRYVKKK